MHDVDVMIIELVEVVNYTAEINNMRTENGLPFQTTFDTNYYPNKY